MNLDAITIILFAAAVILGFAYFARRKARLKKQRHQL